MAVTEESRHHLYQALERVLGPGEATTLMEHLPPVGWADVTTKRDLDALGHRVETGFAELRVEMYRELRNQLRAIVATNIAVGSLVVAALRVL